MTSYYLVPLMQEPCEDLKEIIMKGLRIYAPQRKKPTKREIDWRLVLCPRQESVVECGYFVMRYMKEIIDDPTLIISKVCA
ncbi:hypothetical protein CK203_031850 [Vitis vinifera]|uniref:Ubiquitin-like protease family profile domain-containing protein n=1 Tax=Vitis vinifera TaxID=29760 RepID=A0A438IN40_VITVI|nr:hypothetical protein CK203_031850 [Vitis vinifera]